MYDQLTVTRSQLHRIQERGRSQVVVTSLSYHPATQPPLASSKRARPATSPPNLLFYSPNLECCYCDAAGY